MQNVNKGDASGSGEGGQDLFGQLCACLDRGHSRRKPAIL